MLKYLIGTLALAGIAFGAFQNCSKNEFQSRSGSKTGVVDPSGPPTERIDYQLISYPQDQCLNEGDAKNLQALVVDGTYKHNYSWTKEGSESILSNTDVLPLSVTGETPGRYTLVIDDGYQKVERSFYISLCDDPEEPPQCTPPTITAPQPGTQVSFEGDDRWIGYEVTGDPKPTIKWYFYKNPGGEATEIFPDVFDHYYDFKPILEKDDGYYYIVADNGCGDPVESSHYHIVVKQVPSGGGGSGDSGSSGEIIGWVEDISIDNNGRLYAKGWACSKHYNESINIKIVAQDQAGTMEPLAMFKTNFESKVHDLCLNSGADLHGFKWTSEKSASVYKGKSIFIMGLHPSGNSALDRELKPKKLVIE